VGGLEPESLAFRQLGFFRTVLVVIQGRHEMRAVWASMETGTLSRPIPGLTWKITDRSRSNLQARAGVGFQAGSLRAGGLWPAAT